MSSRAHSWPLPLPPLYPALLSTPLVLFPRKGQGNGASLCTYVSYPPGSSVNDSIHNNDFPLRYSTVYDAIDSVMRLGRGALMAKIDMKSAFRLCPVHPSYHNLFGMKWRGPFYFDHVLPFGLMSAPFIFNCLAIQQGVTHIHHCLDDFFVAGSPDSEQCSQHLHTLVSLCTALGVQLDDDNCLEYLGILLDSALLEACLPPPCKLQDKHHSLDTWATHSSCSKWELLSLIGTLSFADKVVPAGRTFLRSMIDLSSLPP